MTVTAHVKTFLICGHRLQNACSQAETRGLEILGSSKSILHTKVEILRLKSRGVTPLPPKKTSLTRENFNSDLNIEACRYSEREIGVIGDPDITYNV